jgi:hypothetical protein
LSSHFQQVASERRQRSLPPSDDSRTSVIGGKSTDYATSRESSAIGRPSFAKMYEFIDMSLEKKLARLVDEAVLSRIGENGHLLHADLAQKWGEMNQNTETAPKSPSHQPLVSMSPAPQPSPFMHSQPPEYPSPTPQLSDISSFGNSLSHSPSTFANVALGWQDSMGLAMNMSREDSPITKALKQITEHLDPSNATSQGYSPLRRREQQQQPPSKLSRDQYKMMEGTTAALSPNSVSPNNQNRGMVPWISQAQPKSPSGEKTANSRSQARLHIVHPNPQQNLKNENVSGALKGLSVVVLHDNKTALLDPVHTLNAVIIPDPDDILASAKLPNPTQVYVTVPNDFRLTKLRFNLLETVHEKQIEEAPLKLNSGHDHFTYAQMSHNSDDMGMEDEAQNVSPADHLQNPYLIHAEDSVANFANEQMGRIEQASPSAIAGRWPQQITQSSEANDLKLIGTSDRLLIRKREAAVLEEGIDSIRGISELLELYTSVPSPDFKYSATKGAVSQNTSMMDSGVNAVLPGEKLLVTAAPTGQQQVAKLRYPEQKQSLEVVKSSIDNILPLLPEITGSPESQHPKMNIVAKILRDALPVKGLEFSLNDSDFNESAISEDGFEHSDNMDSDETFETSTKKRI